MYTCQLSGCYNKKYLKIFKNLNLCFKNNSLFLYTWYCINTENKNIRLRSHTWMENVARVTQSYLTADIWLRAECANTIRDRSKGQHNQLRYATEWHRLELQI